MREQFDSCSYVELTSCIKYRIRFLKEYRLLSHLGTLENYDVSRAHLRLSAVIAKSEIDRLLKMRRILKKSGLKNWDSDLLSVDGELRK